ncbi:MAG: M42 family metallopeptidase [Bacillota bacterium]|nr:M42 family metallopeptidase [Bacillota bacterium]
MLETLSNLNGVSGSEDEVRSFILSKIKADEVTVDVMGNIIAFRKGLKSHKKMMVCAHMDEVGFIISEITDKGFLKFKSVGGIDERVLISKHVTVGPDKLPGVIAVKAVHLQEKEEREKPVEEKDLAIDIGAESKEQAQKLVKIGDYAAFDTSYSLFGDRFMKGKALDDRIGCACLLKLLERNYDFDFYGVFSVCEEIGGTGAKVAAQNIRPDLALVLEGTTCSDVYKTEPHQQVTRLGDGVCIPIRDRSMVANRELVDALIACAEKNKIKWQYKHTTAGGTDGGAIHASGAGVKCAVLAVPTRYIHSPVGVASVDDYEAFLLLTEKFMEEVGGLI